MARRDDEGRRRTEDEFGQGGHTEEDQVEKPARRHQYDDDRSGDGGRRGDRPVKTKAKARRERPERESPLSASAAAQAGARHIMALTGQEPSRITSLEPDDEGWLIGIEVIDHHRIPSSTDILALYEAKIDLSGELLAYSRKRRYTRGDSGELS